MFEVVHKETGETYTVFHVSYDRSGFPHFVIYDGNRWRRLSAKHFKPHHFYEVGAKHKKLLNESK